MRYKKPNDQRTISEFFGVSLAVTSARVAKEEQPQKRPNMRDAAIDGLSGEGGALAPWDMEAVTGSQPTQSTQSTAESTRSEANNNAAAPVTVNREAFMKKMAPHYVTHTVAMLGGIFEPDAV